MKLALVTASLVLSLATAHAWHKVLTWTPPVVATVATPDIVAAHRYHGIKSSLVAGGEHYFIRNGQRCKLFTPGFVQNLNTGSTP